MNNNILNRWLAREQRENPKRAEKWRKLLASELATDAVGEFVALLIHFLQSIVLDLRYFMISEPYKRYNTRFVDFRDQF